MDQVIAHSLPGLFFWLLVGRRRRRTLAWGGGLVSVCSRAIERERKKLWQRRRVKSLQRWLQHAVPAPGEPAKLAVEAAVMAAYGHRQLPKIVWHPSPLALALEASIAEGGADIAQELNKRVWCDRPPHLAGTTRMLGRDASVWRAVRRVLGDRPDGRRRDPAWVGLEGSVWTGGFIARGSPQLDDLAAKRTLLAAADYLDRAWSGSSGDCEFSSAASVCSGVVFRGHLALLSEPPVLVKHDGRGLLHSASGPAIAWADGFSIHAWHGTPVPALIEDPSFDTAAILSDPELAVRGAMLEMRGYPQTLLNAVPLASDKTGRLWRTTERGQRCGLVELENSTREPDGTRKRYFLRVPPDITTPRQAVAWTFGLTADEYTPDTET